MNRIKKISSIRNVLHGSLAVLIIAKVSELIASSIKIGSNIDEPYHLNQAAGFISNGSYILENPTVHEYAYGPAFAIFSHMVETALGFSDLGDFSLTPNSLIFTHLMLALLSLLTALITGVIFFSIYKNYFFSAISILILLSFPFWLGHSIQNIKDIPVAYGITAYVGSVILLINNFTNSNKKPRDLLIFLLVISGIFFSVGSRPSIAVFILLVFFLSLFSFTKLNIRKKTLIYSTIIGFGSTLIVLPQFYREPINALKNTFLTTSKFPWQGTILMDGKLVEPLATPSYFLIWFFAQTPLVLITFFIVGLFAILLRDLRTKKLTINPLLVSFTLILVQIFFMPTLAILLEATVYQSLRHFLFIFPMIAIVTAAGIYHFAENLNEKLRFVFIGSIFAIFIFLFSESGKLNPYFYTYYNPIVTKISFVPLEWETESWWLSNREAIEKTPKNGNLVIWDGVWPKESFFENRGKASEDTSEVLPGDYWAVSTLVSYVNGDSRQRALESGAIFASQRATCTIHSAVKRTLRDQIIPMAYVSKCQNSGNYLDGIASIGWSSVSEVGEDLNKYSWITDVGDSIRISTLRHYPSSGTLSFSLEPNPCNTRPKVMISNNQFSEKIINIPFDSNIVNIKFKLSLKPYSTEEIKISILDVKENSCFIPGDTRNFITKISDINWVE